MADGDVRERARDDDVLNEAARWRTARKVALATVVATWGSSPRPAGSHLAVDENGKMIGSVSGGCIEGTVVTEALEVMHTGAPKLLEYGVTNELAWEVGLACGGTVEVYVERLEEDTLGPLLEDQARKRAVVRAVDLSTGAHTLVYPEAAAGPDAEDSEILSVARRGLRDDRSRTHTVGKRRVFVEVFNPPKRLLIVGAVHIAQPLSRMASVAGYDVTVIDPRASFATDERFPGISLNGEWPDDAMRALDPDRRTAVVTLTHDPKLDDPGLEVALKSDAFYVGALGSRKTHAGRVERLTMAGFTETEVARIHAPVGLDIGAVSPAEIAVSVLAQITETLHRGTEVRA